MTKQYNPASAGAPNFGSWMNAVMTVKGKGGNMDMGEAIAMIHATSPARRAELQKEAWGVRYDKYGASGRKPNGACMKRKKNFLGFGKGSQVMSSSRLSKDAYNQGYLGKKDFDKWLRNKTQDDNLHSSAVRELRRQFDLGNSDRLAHEQQKNQLALLKQAKRETKAPPVPKGEKLSDLATEYKGRNIKRTAKGFEVLGETWTTLSQAKEYVDLYNITGGKVRTKTNPKPAKKANAGPRSHRKTKKEAHKRMGIAGKQPKPAKKKNFADSYIKGVPSTAEITQGKAKAQVYQAGSKAVATVIAANGSREEHTFNGQGSFKAAMSWARLRLHEVANPGGKWKVYPLSQKPKGRKNPEDASVRMTEKFHGTPSTEVLEYVEQKHRHKWLAGMGPLISLKVRNVKGNRDVELFFPDPMDAAAGDVALLCVEETGTQLYATGGDQELPLKQLMDQFGMTQLDVRDNMLIGTILVVTYRTKKKFEKDGKEEIDFFHALGAEGSQGVFPVLLYHPRDESIEIAGGRYYIGKAEPALGNTSPGLIG